ncbi:DNA-3-methyladenine glycosylase [Priestia flexa]|uniref:DNA-3-methyladenine glycosylase family protein n=1 Tax=Priestia flexa TaxID=86664 RepID=UPI0024BFFB5C|nr:DNA-3-methyladenine glycosylase [Priestia flexa]WHX78844.1 DNA-3-methyladenine glycosylase [Priestia flexa]
MSGIIRFSKGSQELRYLCDSDRELCKLINLIGEYELSLDINYFEALVKKIISQQLSVKAASTICNRVISLCGNINPDVILRIPESDLREAGVSKLKISYIKGLSLKIVSGELDLSKLPSKEDSEVIYLLTDIKGIGQWTAEMFLIFSLGRPNILSMGDVGLKRAFQWLYQKESGNLKISDYYEIWNPYNTIASLYLWEAVNRDYVIKFSSIDEL